MEAVNKLMDAIFGGIDHPHMERVNVEKVRIEHFETDLTTQKPLTVRTVEGVEYNDEFRYCLGSLFPEHKTSSYTLKDKEAPSSSELFTFFFNRYYSSYGGTGLNHGQYYATSGFDDSIYDTSDSSVSYKGMLYTPIAVARDSRPFLFKARTLILSDIEMRSIGLVEGNTGIIMNKDMAIQGQFRLYIKGIDKDSVGKGAAFNYDELRKIGVKIPNRFFDYDLIISESHLKIGKLNPCECYSYIGFTYDNTWTVYGNVGHSFEYYQYLNMDQGLVDMILTNFVKVDYRNVLIGEIKGKVITAAKNDTVYIPSEIDTAIQNGFMTFGPEYPAVNRSLQRKMMQYLINSRMPESSMKIVVMCTDAVKDAIHISETPNAILYKYPITAGLGKVSINKTVIDTVDFYPIQESTCLKLNIDGDGDIAQINYGVITDYTLQNNLIKPLRDLAVHGREKNNAKFSLANIAKIMSRILKNSGLIGQLTMAYYRAEIAKELIDDSIDLTVYYKGIESVIKSNKWDMDLSILEKRDFELEKELRSMISDNWREARYGAALKRMFEKSDVDLVERMDHFSVQNRIADPIHYMDYIWNHTLDMAKTEVIKLRDIQKPLSWFSKFVEPQIITDQQLHTEELLVIKQLNYLFNNSIEKSQQYYTKAKDIINVIQGMEFSSAAMSDYLDKFLAQSKGTGMFPLYWKNLSSVVDGVKVELKSNKDKVAASIAALFGEVNVSINRSVLETASNDITIWRSRTAEGGRSIVPEEILIDSQIVISGQSIVGLNAGINGNITDGTYTVVKVANKFNKNGTICETGISVTLSRVA